MAGGILAGYLRGSDRNESALTGALATVLASTLYLGFMALVLLANAAEGSGGGVLGTIILAVLSLGYFYGFGALGGVVGAGITNRNAPE